MTSEYADLAGQVALITGGAGAIGRAISEGLVAAGAKVALVDIAGERLQSYGEELASKVGSGRVLTIVADVCDSQQVRRAFDLTLEEFGRLDILVNNAAATQIKAVDLLSDEDIDLIIDTNLKGYVKCAREAVKSMKASGTQGSLLFISSKNGLVGASNKSLYCATKGGELTMARSLAMELGEFGIRVNTICPDAVLEGSACGRMTAIGSARRNATTSLRKRSQTTTGNAVPSRPTSNRKMWRMRLCFCCLTTLPSSPGPF